MFLAPQIYLSNHSVALISGFSLYRDRFSFNWDHFFLIEIISNLKLSRQSRL